MFTWAPISGSKFRIFADSDPIATAVKVNSGWRVTRRGHKLESVVIEGFMSDVEAQLAAWWGRVKA